MQQGTMEKIGGVALDLSRYPGEDYYCDGEVEDEILEIAKNHREEEFDRIIGEKKSWPVLYHLSSQRENIAGWIPFRGTEKVLEIGAGPGAVTGILSKKCRSVTCVELSKKRSLINAYRHRDADNIVIHVGNFEDIEPELDRDFDYIFLIGVLEYAGSYLHGEDPFREELSRMRSHLKKDGHLVIAIENRLGMKYFAGCREDHSGRYFDGIESYENTPKSPAETFSGPALEKLLQRAGFTEYSFYYPYPDYKFPDTIYSDRRLPSDSELSRNIRNFDRDRLLLFDERKAYRGALSDGLYPLFANSFEVVTGPELPVTYCRFSSERNPKYRIRTAFVTENGTRQVVKYPLGQEARDHVLRMADSCRKLSERFAGTGLAVAPCRVTEDGEGAAFSFISGRTLEELLDEALDRKDREGFLSLLSEYEKRAGANDAVPVSDYDMTFQNILVDGNTWTAIDYEWEVDRAVPVKDLLVRSLVLYIREDPERKNKLFSLIPEEELIRDLGVTREEIERQEMEEDDFQKKIAEGGLALGKLRSSIGGAVRKPAELQTKEELEAARRKHEEEVRQKREKEQALVRVKVYFDTGNGYNESETYVPEAFYETEGMIRFSVHVERSVKNLRIDPASVPCVAMIREAGIDGYEKSGALFARYEKHNGCPAGGGAVLFATDDPWFSFDLSRIRKKAGARDTDGKTEDVLTFAVQMAGIPGTMAEEVRQAGR